MLGTSWARRRFTDIGLNQSESPASRRAFCFCAYTLQLQRDGDRGRRSRLGMEATTTWTPILSVPELTDGISPL
jgi:hypothetical protein